MIVKIDWAEDLNVYSGKNCINEFPASRLHSIAALHAVKPDEVGLKRVRLKI